MTDFSVEQAKADGWQVEWRRNKNAPWQPGEFGMQYTGRDGLVSYRVYERPEYDHRTVAACNIRNLPRPAADEHVVAVQVQHNLIGEHWARATVSTEAAFPPNDMIQGEEDWPSMGVDVPRTEIKFRDGQVVEQDGVELVARSLWDAEASACEAASERELAARAGVERLQTANRCLRGENDRLAADSDSQRQQMREAYEQLARLKREVLVNAEDVISLNENGVYDGQATEQLQAIVNLCQPDPDLSGPTYKPEVETGADYDTSPQDDAECCCECGDPTGRAGKGDDSIYDDDGNGPYCENCCPEYKRTYGRSPDDTDGEMTDEEYNKKLLDDGDWPRELGPKPDDAEAGEDGVVGFCPKCGCDGEADAKLADLRELWERAADLEVCPICTNDGVWFWQRAGEDRWTGTGWGIVGKTFSTFALALAALPKAVAAVAAAEKGGKS